MAAGLQSTQASAYGSCKLISLFESSGGEKLSIDLPHEVGVVLGRDKTTTVRSFKCSRRQVRLTADHRHGSVRVEQIGDHPSVVGGTTLTANNHSILGPSGVVEFPGGYKFAVFFETDGVEKGLNSSNDRIESTGHRLFNDDDSESNLLAMEIEKGVDSHSRKRSKGKEKKVAIASRTTSNPKSGGDVGLHRDENFEEDEKEQREMSESKRRKISQNDCADHDSRFSPAVDGMGTGTNIKHQATLSSFLGKGPGKSHDGHMTSQWEWIDSVRVFRRSSSSSSSGDGEGGGGGGEGGESGEGGGGGGEGGESGEGGAARLSDKLALFDLDYTLTATKSGRRFSRDGNDWKWLWPTVPQKLRELVQKEGKSLVVLSNQASVGRVQKEADLFTKKVQAIAEDLGQPLLLLAATGKDRYRKPRPGMWDLLVREGRRQGVEIRPSNCFYVGDAAGRLERWAAGKTKDFSCSDRKFAANVGLDFFTPEEYFFRQTPAPFSWGEFNPREWLSNPPPQLLEPTSAKIVSGDTEVVVFVGAPGCGKSSFYRRHMAKDYGYANRDTLGTWQACVKTAEKCLAGGRSVAVDNTNADPEMRKRYVDVAQRFKVPVRCFLFTASIAHARHNNTFRSEAATDPAHKKVPEQVFNMFKSRFVEPTTKEGFAEVVRVNFVPHFKSPTERQLYEQFYT